MSQLPLLPSVNDQRLQPGDFGGEITEAGLSIPPRLFKILAQLSIQTAEEFVGYVGSFPGGIAWSLNWKVADVLHAHIALVEKLKGHVSNWVLFPKEHPRHTYGAVHPQCNPK